MTTFESRRRVLFVDDDRGFLETMRRVMGALSHGSWEIFTSETTAQAFATLQEHPLHLVVIDVQMPVMDGLQFLTLLNRRHPNLQKVILTGFAGSESYRAACLSNGAELFLDKPNSSAGHESLFATLNELIKWQPEEGFRGVLRRVGLQDVLQMECLSRNSSVLEVKASRKQGVIFIRDGQIVHAVLGDRKGEMAFNQMLALRGGEFVLRPFSDPGEQSLEGSWEFLLMEAARMRDEMGDQPAPDFVAPMSVVAAPEEGVDGESVANGPPPEDGEPPACPVSPTGIQAGAPDSRRVQAQQVGSGRGTAVGEGAVGTESRARPPRTIEEILVCSAQGEVLHEYQCRNSDLWVNFFEFISQKSRRLSQGLVLGAFDRIEVVGSDTRLVALVSARRGVLVRSRAAQPPPAAELGTEPGG